MELDKSCPKCNNVMQSGFILDHKDHSSNVVAQWQPGEPQRSFWFGVQTKDSPQYEIRAYRCRACGYLESYAL
jgi:predicted nucleic-acid-binding Zn-ribbon protein